MGKSEHRLRELRQRLGLMAQQLGKKAGLSKSYVSQLESGVISGHSPKIRRALAGACGLHPVMLGAYLDGYLSLDEIALDANERSALDKALDYHDGKWSETTIKAARRLPLRGLSPQDWARQLDDMEAAVAARPTIWDWLVNPSFDESRFS